MSLLGLPDWTTSDRKSTRLNSSHANYERILKKRFPEETASGVLDLGNLLLLRLGARHEQMVADFCEEALEALSAMSAGGTVVPLEEGKREGKG